MNAPSDKAAPRLTFGRFVLDPDRGCLASEGSEVALRPKTFSLLTYLASRPGQWVMRDELLEVIWQGLVVSEDSLDQCVLEARRAMGDNEGKLLEESADHGFRLDFGAAPGERRHAPGVHALRFRFIYGVMAPLAVVVVFAAIWFITSRDDVKPPVAVRRPAIAILPFQNQIDDPREYIADGLTQELIGSMGRYPGLTVMAWNSVASYKGAIAQPGEIARVLEVRFQVEGSVRYFGDRLHVSVQLADLQGMVLWSARFDEPATQVLALSDRIAGEIGSALGLDPVETEPAHVLASFEAWDLLSRARARLHRPSREGLDQARELLGQAVIRDAGYGEIHALLGETFALGVHRGWSANAAEDWQRVASHAADALHVDAVNVRARVLLAREHLAYQRYREAEREIDLALRQDPNDADALGCRGSPTLWLSMKRKSSPVKSYQSYSGDQSSTYLVARSIHDSLCSATFLIPSSLKTSPVNRGRSSNPLLW